MLKSNSGLTRQELAIFRRLNTPKKIQNYLDGLRQNFNRRRDTCQAPRQVLQTQRAHCIEAAILAAAVLRFHGRRPLLLDLAANQADDDHVIALFQQFGCWGAISKSNHAVLRYREPVYRTVRELVMSYFNEYTNQAGRKTLRAFSQPVSLARFDRQNWLTAKQDLWYIAEYLCEVPHQKILSRQQIANLRPLDKIERAASNLTQYR